MRKRRQSVVKRRAHTHVDGDDNSRKLIKFEGPSRRHSEGVSRIAGPGPGDGTRHVGARTSRRRKAREESEEDEPNCSSGTTRTECKTKGGPARFRRDVVRARIYRNATECHTRVDAEISTSILGDVFSFLPFPGIILLAIPIPRKSSEKTPQ